VGLETGVGAAPRPRRGRFPIDDRAATVANRLSLGVLAGYFAVESTRRIFASGRLDLDSLGDFLINLSRSQQILEAGRYGDHFYYPLPFLILQEGLGALGLPLAAALWFTAVSVAGVALGWLCLDALGLREARWRWAIALLAYASVLYFVQWDLRAKNLNILVLAVVLGSLRLGRTGRPWAAGALLSLAVAAKLYAVVLLPYLAWRRRWSWLAASATGLLVLFAVLPVLRLGPSTAFDLSLSWLGGVLDPGPPLSLPDYYKPLHRSLLLWLTEAGGPERSVAAWPPSWVTAAARLLQLGWVALAASQLRAARSFRDGPSRLFADAAVLLLLPLPFSPTFQAHHAVVLVLTAFWMVRVAVDGEESRARRIRAGGILLGTVVLLKLVQTWPARALAIEGAMALHLLGLRTLPPRWRASTAPDAD
jgi:hypothetical protein